jgi:hypothetical protein
MTRLQGSNSEFLENPSTTAKNRPENNSNFSILRDLRDEIPRATEHGINSTATGNAIRENRELIRANRESIPPSKTRVRNIHPLPARAGSTRIVRAIRI